MILKKERHNKNAGLALLTTPWFIGGLVVLFLNDFILKDLFSNWFTGKLSDFAGLFVFALFWIALFPKYRKLVLACIALAFVFWKSAYAQGFIDFWNEYAPFTIARVVDSTDLLALSALPIANRVAAQEYCWKKFQFSPVYSLLIAAFAFGATSQADVELKYGKKYDFEMSAEELVNKINQVPPNSIATNYPLSLNFDNANFSTDQLGGPAWYYLSGYEQMSDTIYTDSTQTTVDHVYEWEIPILDSSYVDQAGVFYYTIQAEKYMLESETGYCETVTARIILKDNGSKCSLILESIETSTCLALFDKKASKNEKRNLRMAFENELIKELKK